MNRLIYLLLITLFCSVQVQAQTISHENEPDSFSLEEIIVTGTMPKVNLKTVPMSISVVSGITIENRLQSSLLPLLSEEVPGLFITQRGVMGFGVAEGSAGSMSIRGIGGTPTSGVLVLIDGHPQYMGLMGHPLADSYQSMITERVEVIRGPASMLYGSNAMGGVINIITKKQKTNGKNLLAQVMYGSYNSLITEVTGGFRKNQIHANGNIGLNRSDGHRENMEFEQINGNGNLGYDFTENWTGFVDFNISKTLSSNPGSIKNPYINNDADILRGVASAVIENEYKNTSGAVKFYYNFGSHYI
ncbi:MAG: TonB-dependent receptor plug domain-containing protein, partial [Dysgonamonadaceae bacterium]